MTKLIFDKTKIVKPAGEIEDFKRPNHPDFMDSSELAKIQWSGIRHNSVTQDCEIWILGEIKKRVTVRQLILDQYAIDKALEEVLAVHEVAPDLADLRKFRAGKKRPSM